MKQSWWKFKFLDLKSNKGTIFSKENSNCYSVFVCRVSFIQWRLKVQLESPQHLKFGLEKFLSNTKKCSFAWQKGELTLNSCVLQVKRNKAFPSALSYLSQDTSLKQDAILFSFFVLSFRPLSNWMGKEDTSSHYLLYQTLFSVLFSTRKSPKNNCTWRNTRVTLKKPWNALLYYSNKQA